MTFLFLDLLTITCIYWMLAQSLHLMLKYLGLMSLAHAAMFGCGAYAVALLQPYPLLRPYALAFAIGTACIIALPVWLASIKTRGEVFAISTFALQTVFSDVLTNATELTRGALGISGIMRPDYFQVTTDKGVSYLAVCGSAAVISQVICWSVMRKGVLRLARLIRDDEALAISVGKDVSRFKLKIIVLSAGLAGVAGLLHAYYNLLVVPKGYLVSDSILLVAMVILGSPFGRWAPVVGACVMSGVPGFLRFAGLPPTTASDVRQLLLGLVIISFAVARPRELM